MVNLRVVKQLIRRFVEAAQGNADTEYAVSLALIVMASILSVQALCVEISELFPDLAGLVG